MLFHIIEEVLKMVGDSLVMEHNDDLETGILEVTIFIDLLWKENAQHGNAWA